MLISKIKDETIKNRKIKFDAIQELQRINLIIDNEKALICKIVLEKLKMKLPYLPKYKKQYEEFEKRFVVLCDLNQSDNLASWANEISEFNKKIEREFECRIELNRLKKNVNNYPNLKDIASDYAHYESLFEKYSAEEQAKEINFSNLISIVKIKNQQLKSIEYCQLSIEQFKNLGEIYFIYDSIFKHLWKIGAFDQINKLATYISSIDLNGFNNSKENYIREAIVKSCELALAAYEKVITDANNKSAGRFPENKSFRTDYAAFKQKFQILRSSATQEQIENLTKKILLATTQMHPTKHCSFLIEELNKRESEPKEIYTKYNSLFQKLLALKAFDQIKELSHEISKIDLTKPLNKSQILRESAIQSSVLALEACAEIIGKINNESNDKFSKDLSSKDDLASFNQRFLLLKQASALEAKFESLTNQILNYAYKYPQQHCSFLLDELGKKENDPQKITPKLRDINKQLLELRAYGQFLDLSSFISQIDFTIINDPEKSEDILYNVACKSCELALNALLNVLNDTVGKDNTPFTRFIWETFNSAFLEIKDSKRNTSQIESLTKGILLAAKTVKDPLSVNLCDFEKTADELSGSSSNIKKVVGVLSILCGLAAIIGIAAAPFTGGASFGISAIALNYLIPTLGIGGLFGGGFTFYKGTRRGASKILRNVGEEANRSQLSKPSDDEKRLLGIKVR